MPKQKKVTLKQLKEFADDATQELNTYFSIHSSSWHVFDMTSAGIDLRGRATALGATADQIIQLQKVEKALASKLTYYVAGRGYQFDAAAELIAKEIPEVQEILDENRYVTLTPEDISVLNQATEVIRKLDPTACLGYSNQPSGYMRNWVHTDRLRAGQLEKESYSQKDLFINNSVLNATVTEIDNQFKSSLAGARDIFSTRVRRHGGKMRFTHVDQLVQDLKGSSTTPEDAQAAFKAIPAQVEDSLNNFTRLLLNPPKPLALTVNLKELRYQEVTDSEESTPDYLEVE
jgi:hypothetical protein